MSTRQSLAASLIAAFLAACSPASTPDGADTEPRAIDTASSARVIGWSDMIPEGEDPRPIPQPLEYSFSNDDFGASISGEHDPASEGGTLADAQVGTFNTIDHLQGERVRLPGFIVPLDFEDGAVTRFLLVPYYGACIHAPPPPPNQTLFVHSDEPVRLGRLSQPIWVEGVLETGRFDSVMGDAAYSLEVDDWDVFQGRVDG